jgi:hypothetical protein
MNVDVASTVAAYLFIHSFFGRREEIKRTSCSVATAAVYYVSREILEHILCTNTHVDATGTPVGDS